MFPGMHPPRRRLSRFIALALVPIGGLFAQDLTGTWQGSVTNPDTKDVLRTVLKIASSDGDPIKANFYSIDQTYLVFPATLTRQGPVIKMSVPGIAATWEGKLSADGTAALVNNTTGIANTASGVSALNFSTTGSHNTALGYEAGLSISTGSNNIDIGNAGLSTDGVSVDSGVIRIGTPGAQTTTFIAGISGVTASGGAEVFVNGNGQLGTINSSRRFKEQITDMGDGSSKPFQLRPVNFFYKPEYDDGSHLLQYGLIAEEVAKVYPEMVAYGSDGQILTVKYQMLAPMLLNEAQKQNAQLQKEVRERQAEDLTLKNKLQLQAEENRKLEDRLAAMEALLSSLSGGNRRGLEQTIR
jgi:hypothetical protein